MKRENGERWERENGGERDEIIEWWGKRESGRGVEEGEKRRREGSKDWDEGERYREAQIGRETGRGEREIRDKGEKTEAQWLCLESCFQATPEVPGTLVYTSLQPGLN